MVGVASTVGTRVASRDGGAQNPDNACGILQFWTHVCHPELRSLTCFFPEAISLDGNMQQMLCIAPTQTPV